MQYLKIAGAALALSTNLISACSDYRFTVNDKLIYTPEALFEGYSIADENLRNCIKQTVKDRKITAAIQLKELSCSHAGILDLRGIEIFTALTLLELSDNKITDLAALHDLQLLRDLRLDGNPRLPCQQLQHLQNRPEIAIVKPAHCG